MLRMAARVRTGLLSSWLPAYVAVSFLAAVCYINSLPCGFVFDDVSAIVDNKDVRLDSPLASLFANDFWGTPIAQDRSHKSYRPLCVITFRLNYALGGLDPRGYHAVNVLLHVFVSILLLSICRRLCFVDRMDSCAIAAALFAVHPIHTEAVTGVVGRAELLSASFALLALHAYASAVAAAATTGSRMRQAGWCLATSACVFCATFSKEQGITIVGVCAAYDVFVVCQVSWLPAAILRRFRCKLLRRQVLADDVATAAANRGRCLVSLSTWLRIGSLFVTAAVVLAVRLHVMGSELPVFLPFDNPAASAPSPTRQLTYNYLLPLNVWLLLCPSHLLCDWTMGTVPLVRSVADPRNVATVALYAVLLRLCYLTLAKDSLGPRRPAVVLGLALTVTPFLPASNLLFPVGFVVAERVLYAPSMGYCILLAQGAAMLSQQRIISRSSVARRIFAAAMIVVLIFFTCKTIVRNYDWTTERSLFEAALKVTRDNAKVYNNIGHTYEAEGRHDVALAYFRAAARKQPDDIGSHINVGRAFANLQQWASAEDSYREALALMPAARPGKAYSARVAPSHLAAYVGLANLVAKNASRLFEADRLYRSVISMRPDYVQAYINRGSVLMQLGRHDEAAQQYRMTLELESGSGSMPGTKTDDIYYNLGVAHLSAGRTGDALEYFDKALLVNAAHKLSLYNSAVLIQEQQSLTPRRQEAVARLRLLLQLDPSNADAFFTQALLATDLGDFKAARASFLSAIELRSDFRGALFNLALLLVNDLSRPLEAVPYLEQCLRHHPMHAKSHLLLGDIRLTHLNDTAAAEEHFRSVLAIEPGHVQAEHNLCVVLVRRGQLDAAEQCLETLLPKAPPGATYIAEHLAVVRSRLASGRKPAVSKVVQEPKAAVP